MECIVCLESYDEKDRIPK